MIIDSKNPDERRLINSSYQQRESCGRSFMVNKEKQWLMVRAKGMERVSPWNSLVNWTKPALERDSTVGEGWKGFVYALESIDDKDGAIDKARRLNGFDDGNSLSNLLWWIHSRDGDDDDHEEGKYGGHGGGGKYCSFGHYCN
ncbi:unnamed protein product [Arabis nemorensis]|uniref:Uncharacterized protein n=1 Tax=Arabis nemorensis TaxID=586526 RepID=A0A565AZN7_9BRAS|nr:unnamed protein product [Arabis nemorensis]